MMSGKFIHLHVHSEYSLLDGLPKTKHLVKKAKELTMDTLAISDHGAMYGAIDFYKAARAEGIKPIIGMEAYTTLLDHKTRPEKVKGQNNHLLLLAKNEVGYKNLMKITSIAHMEGYYYKPRITRTLLSEYAEGLVCTSACPAGEVAQALIDEDYGRAKETVQWFLDVFGEDYYLEVQRHEYAKYLSETNAEVRKDQEKMIGFEKIINEGVVKLSRDMGVPIVATNDSHYINKDDAEAQDVLVCVATGKLTSETKRIRMVDTPTYYLKSEDEMEELFPDIPEALSNTLAIGEKCNLEIGTFGKWFFPKFDLPKEVTPEQKLVDLFTERLPQKVDTITDEVKARGEYELGIINQKGYAPYFLIVMDMVNWANSQGIITNTRGSAAGSLVSFVLGITTVNPITYLLPFERFLNPYRPSPPDIDFDVADDRREEIIGYIVERYGRDRVAQICTFGRMLARAAVRDVSRVLGYPYATGDRISKLIPPPKQGFPIDVPKALAANPQLNDIYTRDSDAKKILDLAHHVEGSARHISVHAAGVVVAPSDLNNFTPLQFEPKGEKVITQYEMHACEDVGLIKFDILGIRNLSILGSAIKIVKDARGIDINIREVDLDNTKTFEMLGRGETMGVFQLGGSGMTRYLKDLKPERVEDLMAMVALYRPGPMQVIPEYIARKRDNSLVAYLDPRMKKFLDKSYGLIVYQDDLLFCAIDLAGYTWEEADKFRKAVGKKIPEEMAAQKEKFTNGIISNGQTAEFAENLWKLFEPFQAYGFNKAHAASYGMVAYYTAYMKANYPVEYMCALLTAESNDTDKITAAIAECRRMKIKVLPPDINESVVGFKIIMDEESLDGRAIRFGLSAIKNVGVAAIEAILDARNKPFLSLGNFIARVDGRRVNKKVLESLIKVGGLSKFGTRTALLASMEELKGKVIAKKVDERQQDLFDAGESDLVSDKLSLAETIEFLSDVPEYDEDELAALERQLLGFSLSAKPISELIYDLEHLSTHKIVDLSAGELVGKTVKVAAVVSEVRVIITKKTSQEMAFVKVNDGTGTLDLVVFPSLFEKTRTTWVDGKPLLISGKVDMRDEELGMIVDTIETTDSVNSQQGSEIVHIRIPKGTTQDQLLELKNALVGSPGSQQVKLMFEGKSGEVALNIKVYWDRTLSGSINIILSTGAN